MQSQTAAELAAKDAEAHQTKIKATEASIEEMLSEIRQHKSAAELNTTDIAAALTSGKQSSETLKSLADIATLVDERIAQYEATLASLKARGEEQLTTITGLLPGATSAGLAHAFSERAALFIVPGRRWQLLFVSSILVLAALSATGFWQIINAAQPLEFSELLRFWLARLPFAAALIWLALHSSREAALAKRLEEDYGYKAAIAASFQGFQRQMAEIGSAAAPESALATLSKDTLATIATPPGRIYERHKLTVSPGTEIAGAGKAIKEALDGTKPAK